MKPEQFIREFGEKKAREVVEGIPSKYMECYYSTLIFATSYLRSFLIRRFFNRFVGASHE
ncbi:hypothetical protein Q4016_07225 [Acinetobacter baumannii]